MNKTYLEKLDYLMKYLDKESIAIMLLNTTEGDKLVSIYIEITQKETINKLKRKADILRGEDIKEIPQFEGTLEQLDKLSIRGEDNGNVN